MNNMKIIFDFKNMDSDQQRLVNEAKELLDMAGIEFDSGTEMDGGWPIKHEWVFDEITDTQNISFEHP